MYDEREKKRIGEKGEKGGGKGEKEKKKYFTVPTWGKNIISERGEGENMIFFGKYTPLYVCCCMYIIRIEHIQINSTNV